MMRLIYVAGFSLAYVVCYVLAITAIAGGSLSAGLQVLVEGPGPFSPGLELHSTSQFAALYNGTALFAIAACIASLGRRELHAPPPAITSCRGLLIAPVTFLAAFAMLFAYMAWTEMARRPAGDSSATASLVVFTSIAIVLALRWWHLAGASASDQWRSVASSAVVAALLRVNLVFFVGALAMALAAPFHEVASGASVFVLLTGSPMLLISHLILETMLFRMRRARPDRIPTARA